MSGYKRVNFYELCRLCATNQQKEKTHIFQEEGRKIQLQNKIQSCLSLKVCENDFLPKVVCSQCLRTLEECYTFRTECVTSETMLSSYFNNFRYTEDFKKSGKVYIKDVAPKQLTDPLAPDNVSANAMTTSVLQTSNHEQFLTVQLPVQNEAKTPLSKSDTQQKPSYNLNLASALKGIVPKGDAIAVNANGEIINIAPLLDLESILINSTHKSGRHAKPPTKKSARSDNLILDANIIQIDLNQSPNSDIKLPHIKSTNSKYTYTIKMEDGAKCLNINPVAVNQAPTSFSQPAFVGAQSAGANLNVGNSLNGWSQHLTTPTTSSNSPVAASNVSPTNNIVPTSLGQFTPDTTMNFSGGNSNWNVSFGGAQQGFPCAKPDAYNNNNNNSKKPRAILSNAGVVQNVAVKEEQAQSKLYPCDSCQKVFKRREHLYQHVKLHTGFRPFVCENCNKSFMRKEHLMRHMTSHSGLKNYTCDLCSKSFSRNDNLLKHKKTHDKQTSFTCEICQKQFVMKHYYLAHRLTHETEKCPMPLWNVLKT